MTDTTLPPTPDLPAASRGRWGRRPGQGKARAPKPPSLLFEPLEPRILLSADPRVLAATTALSSNTVVQSPDVQPSITIATAAVQSSGSGAALTTEDAPDPAPPVTGSIDVPGQSNQYSFTLTAPKSVYFDSLTNDGSITWSLSGPRGSEVDHRAFAYSDGANAPTPPALQLGAGTYTLTVDASGNHTGGYGFRLLDLGTAQPLTPGTQIADSLTPANQARAYQFSGTAGERVFLDAQAGSNLYWHLLDQYGNNVVNTYFSDQQATLANTGQYTLLLDGAVGAGTAANAYSFTVVAENDPTAALTLGATTSGTIAAAGQHGVYTFTVASETKVSFDALTNDGSLNWTLTGPAGKLVDGRGFTGSDGPNLGGSNLLDLPPGSYTLTIAGSGDHTGGYSFRLLDLGAATAISKDSAVTGTLDIASSRAFAFTATRGDQIALTVPTANFNIYYRLYDSSGQLLTADYLRTATTPLTLQLTGDYTLVLESAIGITAAASYGFTVASQGAVTIPAFTGTAITLGSIVTKAATAGEVDDYLFTTTGAATIDLQPVSGYGSASWVLDGPRGPEVSAQGLYNPLVVTLPVAGTYRLRITASSATTYGLQLLDLGAATAVAVNTLVSASLTSATAAKAYRFGGTAGDRFYLEAPDTGSNLRWKLLDAYGNVVFDQGLGNTGPYTLATTGTYTLIVGGYYYAGTAATTFSFKVDREADTTAVLTLGAAVTGTLTQPGQLASYSFTLAADARLYLDSLTQNGSLQWTLTGPRGIEADHVSLAEYADRILSVPAGTYTLTISGSGATTGAYGFRLDDLAAATALSFNTPVTAVNVSPATAKLYSFTGAVGDRVLLNVTSTDDQNLNYRIVDPFGRDLVSRTGYGSSGVITLPYAGTYTLIVQGFYFDAATVANFGFTLVKVVDTTASVALDAPAQTGPLSVPGKIGTALDFTGTEYVSVPNSSATDLRSTVTAEFWINPQRVPNTWAALVYKGDNTAYGDSARTYTVWLNAAGYIQLDTQDASGDQSIQTTSGSVVFGQWTHVAAVMDRAHGTLSIYLNGVLAASGAVRTGPANGNTQPLLIGFTQEDGNDYSLVGTLDDVRLYNRALSATEVAGSMTAAPATIGSDLTVYLPMNDATGAATLANLGASGAVATVVKPDAGLPGTITDRIAIPGQTKRYTFTLATATMLVFDGLSNNSSISVTLTGPGGLSVTRNLRNGDSFELGGSNAVIQAPAGSYTISVTETGTGTDPFAFRFVDLAKAQAITLGTPVTATLADGGSTLAYSFAATAGDRIFTNVQSFSKDSSLASFRLIDPYGNQIFGPSYLADIGSTTLPFAGTYTLLVEGRTFSGNPATLGFTVARITDKTIALTPGTNPAPGPYWAPGQLGGGVRFSGVETVAVPDTAALDLVNNVTLEAWVKADQLPPTWSALIYKGDASDSGGSGRTYSLWLRYDGAVLLSTSRTTGGEQSVLTAAGVVKLGQFVHIAGVIDRTNGQTHIYINGVDVADGTLDTTLAPVSSQPLLIGGTTETNYAYSDFRGTIDDVRIWSVARTATQIAANDAAPLSGTQAGLAAYFKFDEASGNTAADSSGHGLTATLQRQNAGGVTGSIDAPGQSAIYSFTLTGAKTFYFDSQSYVAGFQWSLTGPGGAIVTNRALNNSDANRALSLLQLAAGNYSLTINATGDTTGFYNFALLDLSAATAITPGTATTVTLKPGDAAKLFSFTATAGERVLFDGQQIAGGTVYVRVIDPNGTDLYGSIYAGSLQAAVRTLAIAGTYTIIVDGDVYYNPGAASISLLVQPVNDTTAALTVGTEVDGSIANPGQTANYTFTLTAAARLAFDSLTQDSNLSWTLTGPAGVVVSNRSFTGSDSYDIGAALELDLAAGSYTLSVTGNQDHTASFAFRLLDFAAATPLAANTATAISVPVRSTQLYSFSGQIGDSVELFSSAVTGSASWRLIDPNGVTIFGPQGLASEPAPIRLTSTGRYTLLVESRIYDTTPTTATLMLIPSACPP